MEQPVSQELNSIAVLRNMLRALSVDRTNSAQALIRSTRRSAISMLVVAMVEMTVGTLKLLEHQYFDAAAFIGFAIVFYLFADRYRKIIIDERTHLEYREKADQEYDNLIERMFLSERKIDDLYNAVKDRSN